MENIKEKVRFAIRNDSIVYCLNVGCVNNVQNTCNLKGLSIDETGQCSGLTKIKIKVKNKTK